MYRVELSYPVEEDWEALDLALAMVAGRPSDYSAVTCSRTARGRMTKVRQHAWHTTTFDDAVALRRKLAEVRGVTVTARET